MVSECSVVGWTSSPDKIGIPIVGYLEAAYTGSVLGVDYVDAPWSVVSTD